MFRTKKDVDRHVQEILRKLKSENERNLRCYNIAKLYYQVGDYESARRYVSSYLEIREESPGAHALLGQTLEALGQKEAALAQYKISLELESRQDNLVLKVCELLADTDVSMDMSRARYWVDRADRLFPHHPVVFQLKEKLLTVDRPNDNAEDLETLIASELTARPTDVNLRVKLLRYYIEKNRLEDAYRHAAGVEVTRTHRDNIVWYQGLCELLVKCKDSKRSDWSFWILYISALERFAALSLKEQGDGPKKTVPEAAQAVFNFDQSLTEAKQQNILSNPAFMDQIFIHMWGQLQFHLACLLLRKIKREQGSWSEAGRLSAPLLLGALHVNPMDPTALWATCLKDQYKTQVQLWYREGSYRCSQAGHVLHDYARDDTKRLLDKIDKFCTGTWKERIYQRIFVSRMQQQLMETSYFANHSAPNPPPRLCSYGELKRYDEVSEEVWPGSLHHQVWLGIKNQPHYSHNTKQHGPHPHQYSHVFPELQLSVYNLNQATADSLSRLDIDAFLNAAVLCASVVIEEQQRSGFLSPDRLPTLPADITNSLCTCAQEKWWSSAYKMYHEQGGIRGEIGEIRQILQRGLEVVRCIGNHGLHPTLLVHLARIFHHRIKVLKEKDEKHLDISALEARCELYWSAAVPLLERLQNNQTIRTTSTKLFDYQGKEMNNVEVSNALEEGRLLLAQRYLRDKQHEQAIDALQALKCPEASFQQGQVYKKLADDLVSSLPRESLTSEMRSQHIIMLSKARDCFYLTLDRLRSPGTDPKHPLNSELCTHISAIENELKRIDPDLWQSDLNRNECDVLSDESYSSAPSGGEQLVINTSSAGLGSSVHILSTPQRNTHRTPKQSSTPCRPQHQDILELSRNRTEARPSPERLDAQIRQLIHSRDSVIQTVIEQNKALLESNRTMIEQLEELKKEIADMRKENQKQRSQPVSSVSQNIEEDLYVLDEEDYGELNYGVVSSAQPVGPTSSFSGGMFAPAPRHPAYSQLVYPTAAAIQGYYQGAMPFNDPIAQHVPPLYPANIYPMSPLYPRPPVDRSAGPLPKIPENVLQQELFLSRLPNQLSEFVPTADQSPQIQSQKLETSRNEITAKDAPVNKAPPVNVVITTSDTLPTTVPSVQPTLSVTIPVQHRLGSVAVTTSTVSSCVPHNYQITMPSQATIPTTVNLPPLTTTYTTTMPTIVSTSEKSDRANVSNLSTGSRNSSNEWYNETEHDPIPDFVPVVPLPDEVEVTTGEENETTLYCARAKLFRFVDKEWKERGVGNVKLLRNSEGKVRLLMRRDQVLKICANHMLRPEMELTKMPNNDTAWIWVANDFADEEVKLEKLCIKFKTAEEANHFKESFDKARSSLSSVPKQSVIVSKADSKVGASVTSTVSVPSSKAKSIVTAPVVVGGFSFTSKPIIQEQKSTDATKIAQTAEDAPKISPFVGFSFTKSDSNKSVPISTSIGAMTTGGTASLGTASTVSQSTEFSFAKTNVASTPDNFSLKKQPSAHSVPATMPTVASVTSSDASSSVLQPSQSGSASRSSNALRTPLRRPHAPAPAELAAVAASDVAHNKAGADVTKSIATSKDDSGESVEEFVPNVEFAPVVPLPDIVEIVTGEEGETVLFEQRAKLLRFDSETKQWKDRGTGQMKILLDRKSGKVRLLMRREKVLKVCCNHTLLAEMKFTVMNDSKPTISWFAQDYSEGEVRPEMFAIRFKTAEQASEFHKILTSHQQKMINDRIPIDSVSQESQKVKITEIPSSTNNVQPRDVPAGKQQKSLSEMFKPASGSWECNACYTRNDAAKTKCIACETPCPNATKSDKQQKSLSEMFKPASGSWECSGCYTRNDATKTKCIACETPCSNVTKSVETAPQLAASSEKKLQSESVPLSQLLRLPTGSWECKGCYIINTSSNQYCVACDTAKDPTMPPKPKVDGFNVSTCSTTSTPAFSFGIPQGSKEPTTGGFTFGIPKSSVKAEGDSILSKNADGSEIFAKSGDSSTKFVFGIPQQDIASSGMEKPFKFGSPGKSFDFHFQKSPVKSPSGGENSEDEVAESEDIYFTPVVPLPDKVEVKTGEENEEILYGHRAKLFRFDAQAKEWKERGLGDIKLLRHRETGKLRLVMRRDQVLKLCLNHVVSSDLELTPKDDKTWLWHAADYSEGEIEHEQFACRFKTAEIAQEFKKIIDNAKKSTETPVGKSMSQANVKSPETIKRNLFGNESPSDEVEILYELRVTPEEKAAALKLQLPENFYAYRRKNDCSGCIGCREPSIRLFEDDFTPKKSHAESTKVKESFSTNEVFSSPFSISRTNDTQSIVTIASPNVSTFSSSSSSNSTASIETLSKDVFETLPITNTTTTATSTTVPSTFGSGVTIKSTTSFKPTPTTTSTVTSGDSSLPLSSSIFDGTTPADKKISAGFVFGTPTNSSNSNVVTSTSSGSNAPITDIFPFTDTSNKTSIFGGNTGTKLPENLKICSPSSNAPVIHAPSIFGDPGSRLFGTSDTTKSLFSGSTSATSVFTVPTPSLHFGTSPNFTVGTTKSIFGGTGGKQGQEMSTSVATGTNIFDGSPKTTSSNVSTAGTVLDTTGKVSTSLFGGFTSTPVFGTAATTAFETGTSTTLPAFGSAANKSTLVFGTGANTSSMIFGGSSTDSPFKLTFGNVTGNGSSIFENKNTATNVGNTFGSRVTEEESKKDDAISFLPTDNFVTFSALATKSPTQAGFKKDPNFSFAGAGTSVFGAKANAAAANASSPQSQGKKEQRKTSEEITKKKDEEGEDAEAEIEADNGQEHDPHFEPIVPLPDAIEVRTGEEDEEKVFCQRAKLYRYVNATREWKERGVGEMKILHHVKRGTYRLLLRREQVHKVVCNLLLTPDLQFGMLNSSDRAWCWAGMNYAEEESVVEELAVKFKNPELAAQFKDVIDKAQQALRERQYTDQGRNITIEELTEREEDEVENEDKDEEDVDEEEEEEEDEEDEDEHSPMFDRRATLFVKTEGDTAWKNVCMGDLKVFYDAEIFGAKIILVADGTGEIVSNTIISMETTMQVIGKECIWSALDYALTPPMRRTLRAVFSSVQVAKEMYMHFEDGQDYAKQADISEPEFYIPNKEQ